MRYIVVNFLVLLLSVNLLYAKRTIVSTATEINVGSWQAGDTIVLKNQHWTNQVVSLRAFGTQNKPVVLIAETSGEVIFNGTSRISISGSYVEVSGINFYKGTLSGSPVFEFRTSSSNLAENCRLTNSAIVDYNPSSSATDSKWISLYGKNNKVDYCSFENKTNSGTLMVVWLTTGIIPAHIIENNYFGYRNPNVDNNGKALNGQEIIRIGDSKTSMQYANCIVRNNFFEHCDGEIEIISNKSCGNLYSNNVFYACKGMLTLRHGNDCIVEGNYFFGNGLSESGGVRIIGEDHKVYNNYFQDLNGTNYRAAICIVRGKENSALSEYFQVKNAFVGFNTFVNCKQSFVVNYNNSTNYTMPPIGTVIAHNHVYNTSSSNTNVLVSQQHNEMDILWKNNLMNMGRYTMFSYDESQIITGKNPVMIEVSTNIPILEPSANSALTAYKTEEYNVVNIDIQGRHRPSTGKLPGASELSGLIQREMPTLHNAGVSFSNQINAVYKPKAESECISFVNTNGSVSVQSTQRGSLKFYDLNGRLVWQKQILSPGLYQTELNKGIYVVQFISDEGKISSHKVIL